jgi:hypothetical protein
MRPSLPTLLLTFGAITATAAVAASCGSTGSHSSPADAGADTSTLPTDAGHDAPAAPDASDGAASDADASDGAVVKTVIPGTNFAFRQYYLGDTDRTGVSSSTAWQEFGANIDGKVTTASSTDVCTLSAGASKQTQDDGLGGIDNSWGENLLPIFLTIFGSSFVTSYNDAVAQGDFTTMIDVIDLTDSGTQSGMAPGWGFAGAVLGHPPTWTVADDWPVYPDWLNDGGLASGSKIAFPAASIDGGTWSSGAPTDMPLELGFGAVGIELIVHHATVSFTHATPTTAATGTVSGILYTQEFLATLGNAAGWLSQSLCSGSAFDSIAEQITQAEDIVHDGTNTAGVPCDAISIGFGFDGVQIGPVDSVTFPYEPLPNICPEAGGD